MESTTVGELALEVAFEKFQPLPDLWLMHAMACREIHNAFYSRSATLSDFMPERRQTAENGRAEFDKACILIDMLAASHRNTEQAGAGVSG